MIAKQTRGNRMRGLIKYLFGPGRHEEHRDPRLIAAWEPRTGDGRLTAEELDDLVADLDAPRRLHGTDVASGYVWQCSLRNLDDDRLLADAEWAAIAHETMARLGFDRDCRWVAVRHADNHIHLAVNLVRENGRVVNLWNDRRTLSAACADFERRYGLQVRAQRNGAGMPGLARAEIERAARTGATEPVRVSLARTVRAAAAAARSEAEFIDRVSDAGLLLRPRWAAGERRVVGYSVAAPTGGKGPLLWFGGGRLAGDLSLPRLRAGWPTGDPEPALNRWTSSRTTTGQPRPTDRRAAHKRRLREDAWNEAGRVVDEIRLRLNTVPVDDRAAWSAATADAAGVLSAVALRVEAGRPGQLSRAADGLARAAQRPSALQLRQPADDLLVGMAGVARTAADALLVARGGHTAVAVLLGQLSRLVQQIQRAHATGERAEQARRALAAAEQMSAWLQHQPTGAGADLSSVSTRHAATAETHPATVRSRRPGAGDREGRQP